MSAIFFLNEVGRLLLARNYKGDVPMSAIDDFPKLIQDRAEPCFMDSGVNYVYIRHADLIILAVSRTPDLNALAVLHFLYRLVDSFAVFVKNVEVESVVDNFVVLYELLDEMMDFGFIQTTDKNLLEEYVTQSSYELEVSQAVSALTDNISWRPPGIWYKKNELFVDVEETLSTQVDTAGNVLNVEIVGAVRLRTFLSGMPVLKLGLNNVESVEGMSFHRASRFVKLNDIGFHQCVSLEKWENDGRIEFIPPDGKFDLLTYRVEDPRRESAKPMFHVDPIIEVKARSRVIIKCKVRAQYKKRQHCSFVEFRFPVPQDCDSPRCKASTGNVMYMPEHQVVVWRLQNFAGLADASMQAELFLSSVDADTSRTKNVPILVNFEMPGAALSGLHVKYLKIHEEMQKYQALPWVRYLTKSGDYEIRHG